MGSTCGAPTGLHFSCSGWRWPCWQGAVENAVKPRHKRMTAIAVGVAALGIAAALVLSAFQKNLVFFFTPSQVAANEAPQGRTFRIGGMVEKGSVRRQADGVSVAFVVT